MHKRFMDIRAILDEAETLQGVPAVPIARSNCVPKRLADKDPNSLITSSVSPEVTKALK